jgi:hypothetical protein
MAKKTKKKSSENACAGLIGSDNPIKLAKEALADESFGNQREWRAFVREMHLAEAVLALDKERKKMRAIVKAAIEWRPGQFLVADLVQAIDKYQGK